MSEKLWFVYCTPRKNLCCFSLWGAVVHNVTTIFLVKDNDFVVFEYFDKLLSTCEPLSLFSQLRSNDELNAQNYEFSINEKLWLSHVFVRNW